MKLNDNMKSKLAFILSIVSLCICLYVLFTMPIRKTVSNNVEMLNNANKMYSTNQDKNPVDSAYCKKDTTWYYKGGNLIGFSISTSVSIK